MWVAGIQVFEPSSVLVGSQNWKWKQSLNPSILMYVTDITSDVFMLCEMSASILNFDAAFYILHFSYCLFRKFLFYFIIYFFIWKSQLQVQKETHTEKKWERENLPLAGSLHKWLWQPGLSHAKLAARSFIWVFHMSVVAQVLGTSSTVFPGH